MRWPFRRRVHRGPTPSEDARSALEQAHRALSDAHRLGEAADDLKRRADEVHDQWQETAERNHVIEAVVDTIQRRARRS